jgi:hypothetical protein
MALSLTFSDCNTADNSFPEFSIASRHAVSERSAPANVDDHVSYSSAGFLVRLGRWETFITGGSGF